MRNVPRRQALLLLHQCDVYYDSVTFTAFVCASIHFEMRPLSGNKDIFAAPKKMCITSVLAACAPVPVVPVPAQTYDVRHNTHGRSDLSCQFRFISLPRAPKGFALQLRTHSIKPKENENAKQKNKDNNGNARLNKRPSKSAKCKLRCSLRRVPVHCVCVCVCTALLFIACKDIENEEFYIFNC